MFIEGYYVMLLPEATKSRIERTFSFREEIRVTVGDVGEFSDTCIGAFFGETQKNGNLIIGVQKNNSFASELEEAYSLFICESNRVVECRITAYGDSGFVRAIARIKRMAIQNEFVIGEIHDMPCFKKRGYIEGFYGKPWTHEQRLTMLENMALFGENTYFYAPKNDPYHRSLWREKYPEEAALKLKKLVDTAAVYCMDFNYCIAPGLSICYSSEADFDILLQKTQQLFDMGIRSFGLLLDDIPTELFYESDKECFDNVVQAQCFLVNKYYESLKRLSEDVSLTVCPTCYHGKGDEAELVDFVRGILSGISVFFTGNDICSKEITGEQADYFRKNTGRQPLYWDNYPVNDAEMFMEMHMGPLIGRSSELYGKCEGIISNCMEYFDCNMIPLITAAMYLWNPNAYEPEEAYNYAVRYLLPKKEREDFLLLSDHFRTSCLNDENSAVANEYFSRFSRLSQTGNKAEAVNTVKEYAERISACARRLKKRNSPIYSELSRWLKKFYLMSEILSLSVEVLEGEDKKELLKKKMSEYNESATVLTSFCFREYIESVLENEN